MALGEPRGRETVWPGPDTPRGRASCDTPAGAVDSRELQQQGPPSMEGDQLRWSGGGRASGGQPTRRPTPATRPLRFPVHCLIPRHPALAEDLASRGGRGSTVRP
jgi:hypothetical protein